MKTNYIYIFISKVLNSWVFSGLCTRPVDSEYKKPRINKEKRDFRVKRLRYYDNNSMTNLDLQ